MIERFQKWAHRASSISVILFAAGLAPVVAWTGGPLAMGYWLYNGWTEPEPADLPFPVGLVGFLVAAAVASLVVEIRTGRQRLSVLTHVLALAAFAVEVHHMVALIRSAAP